MTPKIQIALLAAFAAWSASSTAMAQGESRTPYSMEQFAELGWSVTEHLGQVEGQEKMMVRDAAGQDRIAILHTDRGLLTFETLRHPAER